MPSNVELKCTSLPPLVDSPDIDPYTQKPRTYKGLRDGTPIIPRDRYRNDPRSFFNEVKPLKDLEKFHRVSYTYKVPRSVLYHTNGPDLMCVGPRFSRRSEAQHDGAPCGAAVQWPPYCAGTRISRCLQSCCDSHLCGGYPCWPLVRPCAAMLDEPKLCTTSSKFVCPEYWESSMLPINHHGLLVFPSPSKTFREYQEEDARTVAYVKQLKRPTEYQERYIGRIPVPHRRDYEIIIAISLQLIDLSSIHSRTKQIKYLLFHQTGDKIKHKPGLSSSGGGIK
ncbi:hypothetical protein ECG_03006 [Echinococcus granulosus]|uniref:Stabilizer of axonemal microtubules 2 n=1 Tax=Echinococcus granulosus TaxID=6210 RepID=A0A068WNG2_ECHGR|nr:hypothetical protein ECG_03006 [Echinococcus granulosus]CDS20023.1 hypothetical protein EgrG_000221300 [Echinococcus granulosus]